MSRRVDRELKWVQTTWRKSDYELRDGDEVIQTLRFRSAWGSFATAENSDGCWTFKRVGFLQTRATIRSCGSDQDLALFKNNSWTGGGTLELPGCQYRANTNFWMTSYEFMTASSEPLIRYKQIGGVLHLSSLVEIQPAAAPLPELPWLVALGWYLAVLLHHDSGSS
jgi:hypothetical protein